MFVRDALQRREELGPEVVGAALQSLAGPLARHEVHVDLPADLPLLEFDSVLMERVLCNLLENATKYTPPGSRIEIAAHSEGDRATITVADNGPGLPPGLRRKADLLPAVRPAGLAGRHCA